MPYTSKYATGAAVDAVLDKADKLTKDGKAPDSDKLGGVAASGYAIVSSNLTASRALASDTSGKVAVSAVTATELGYVSGVTSAIQTQLNGKQASVGTTNGILKANGSGTISAATAGTDYSTPTTPVTVVAVTASKTFALTDINTFQACNHASTAINLTVPANDSVAIPVGSSIAVSMDGAAQVAFVAASGVTINPSTTLKISAQYKTAALIKTATDTWVLSGSLKA